jgi:hypothetical protein
LATNEIFLKKSHCQLQDNPDLTKSVVTDVTGLADVCQIKAKPTHIHQKEMTFITTGPPLFFLYYDQIIKVRWPDYVCRIETDILIVQG